MKKYSNKYATDIAKFRDWYLAISSAKERKSIKSEILVKIWGHKRNPKVAWGNFISGRTEISVPVAETIFAIVSRFDHTMDFQSIFNTNITMPNNIQKHLNTLGLNQTELAVIAKIDRSQLNDYINGKNKPSVVHAIRIAKALSTTVEELFTA